MLLIPCPYCGERPELEFAYGGQAHIARPVEPGLLSDDEWAAYLVMRDNVKGLHSERWRHAHGCGRFFNAVRDTTTDEILAAYEIGAPRPNVAPAERRAA